MDADRNWELAVMLIARLERISADSYWAHLASGLRGSLIRWVEIGGKEDAQISELISRGFELLERAAQDK